MELVPWGFESPEIRKKREKALFAKLRQFSFIENEIKRQIKLEKAGQVELDKSVSVTDSVDKSLESSKLALPALEDEVSLRDRLSKSFYQTQSVSPPDVTNTHTISDGFKAEPMF